MWTRAALAAAIVLLCGCDGFIFVSSPSGVIVSTSASSTTMLFYASEMGDPVGHGERRTYYLDDAAWSAISFVDGDVEQVTIVLSDHATGGPMWDLHFAAPRGHPLRAGDYMYAERCPFQSAGHPGLLVSNARQGCSHVSARFTIMSILTGPGNTLQDFNAHFEQYCDGATHALRGDIAIAANPWR